MIELRGISFAYDDAPVLSDVDLTIGEGELLVVSGPTGVGKSTLLGVVTGLVPRFSGGRLTGDVLLDGESIVRRPPRERAHVDRLRRPGPGRRVRDGHGRGGARLRHGAARPRARHHAPPRGGDPRPAGHRRPARPRPAHPVRRAAAAGRDRLGADDAPAPPRARRAHLGARPDRGRGRAGHPDPARPRPRRLGADGRAPPGARGPVRRPDVPADRRRPGHGGGARRPARPLARRPADRRARPGGRLAPAAADGPRRPPALPRPGPRARRRADPGVPDGPAAAHRPRPARRARPHRGAPRRRPHPAQRRRHRPDGPQRLRQVLAAVGGPGRQDGVPAARSTRAAPTRPASSPRCAARSSAWCPRPRPTCSTSRRSARSAPPRTAAAGRAARSSTGSCPASTPTSTPATCRRANGSRSRCRSCSPADPAWSCSTSRPAAWTTPPSGPSPASCAPWPTDGHAVLVATHDVEFVAQVADDVVDPRRGRGRLVGLGPQRRGAVAGVRAAGHQGARHAVAAGRRGRRRARRAAGRMNRAVALSPRSAAGAGGRVDRGADDADLAAAPAGGGPDAGRPAVPLPGPAADRHRRRPGGGQRGRAGPPGARHPGRAQRDQRDHARDLGGHRRDRAGVLPADRGRAGLRPGVRLRPGLHVAVRLRPDDRRRRPVAAVPDAGGRLGGHGCGPAAPPGHREARRSRCSSCTACSRRTPMAC